MTEKTVVTEELRSTIRERGYSDDILPKGDAQRSMGVSNYFTLWMGSIHNIPNYNAVIPFLALAVSTVNIMLGIALAGLVVATLMTVNGRAGAKYGIPFAIQLRSAYGVTGSKLPGFLRGVVAAIAWFGIQNYTGGMALFVILGRFFPSFLEIGGGAEILGLGIPQMISFGVFTLINLMIGLAGGGEVLNKFTGILTPIIYVVFGAATVWAINSAGGIGNILSYVPENATPANGVLVIITIINAFMGVWAAPGAGVADFTQNAKSQEDQFKGQYLSLGVGHLIFAFTSVFVLTAGVMEYGPITSVLDVINNWDSLPTIAIATGTLLMSTISTNATGNIIPAGYQLSALFPKQINYRTGVLIAALISVVIMPWKIAGNITGFLGIIGALLGPVAGVLVADFYQVKKQVIDLDELYADQDSTEAKNNRYAGVNTAAYIATLVGLAVPLLGTFIPALSWLNDISWFVGFGIAYLIYVAMEKDK